MRVAVPQETGVGERRVALVPDAVGKLASAGFTFAVERNAGLAAGFPDDEYAEAGANVVSRTDALTGADAVVRVGRPTAEEVAELEPGTVLIGFLAPLSDPEGIERLAAQGVVAFAMESIPRTTRAQVMDCLLYTSPSPRDS